MSLSPSPGVHSTSLAGEASRRLAYSMGATLLLAGLALLALFSMARQRADLQAARDTQRHFASAINNLDQDWQTASIRHKAGIELSRMLEDRRSRWSGLTGYLTVQGEDNSFTRLAITDAQDRVLYQAGFDDGAALSSFAHGGVSSGWHFDSAGRALFRFYVQPIWLGQGDGMGHLVLFWPMNNGLLYRLAVPETDLTLSWRGEAIASSLGERGLATPDAVREDDAVTVRIHLVSEGAEASDAVLVARHYPSYPFVLTGSGDRRVDRPGGHHGRALAGHRQLGHRDHAARRRAGRGHRPFFSRPPDFRFPAVGPGRCSWKSSGRNWRSGTRRRGTGRYRGRAGRRARGLRAAP